MSHSDDDPTRGFLDQTVPRDDAWDGREPEAGPARPRHVQYPTEPDEPLTAKERRKDTVKRAAWALGPSAAYVAGAALSDDDTETRLVRAERPDPEPVEDPGYGDYSAGYDSSGGY